VVASLLTQAEGDALLQGHTMWAHGGFAVDGFLALSGFLFVVTEGRRGSGGGGAVARKGHVDAGDRDERGATDGDTRGQSGAEGQAAVVASVAAEPSAKEGTAGDRGIQGSCNEPPDCQRAELGVDGIADATVATITTTTTVTADTAARWAADWAFVQAYMSKRWLRMVPPVVVMVLLEVAFSFGATPAALIRNETTAAMVRQYPTPPLWSTLSPLVMLPQLAGMLNFVVTPTWTVAAQLLGYGILAALWWPAGWRHTPLRFLRLAAWWAGATTAFRLLAAWHLALLASEPRGDNAPPTAGNALAAAGVWWNFSFVCRGAPLFAGAAAGALSFTDLPARWRAAPGLLAAAARTAALCGWTVLPRSQYNPPLWFAAQWTGTQVPLSAFAPSILAGQGSAASALAFGALVLFLAHDMRIAAVPPGSATRPVRRRQEGMCACWRKCAPDPADAVVSILHQAPPHRIAATSYWVFVGHVAVAFVLLASPSLLYPPSSVDARPNAAERWRVPAWLDATPLAGLPSAWYAARDWLMPQGAPPPPFVVWTLLGMVVFLVTHLLAHRIALPLERRWLAAAASPSLSGTVTRIATVHSAVGWAVAAVIAVATPLLLPWVRSHHLA
jgi:hypothetical protein